MTKPIDDIEDFKEKLLTEIETLETKLQQRKTLFETINNSPVNIGILKPTVPVGSKKAYPIDDFEFYNGNKKNGGMRIRLQITLTTLEREG